MDSTTRRLPSLDGFRAVAIALVLWDHVINITGGGPGFLGTHRWLWDHGNLGVRIFFVLSGFLITTLLLQEHAETGTVSLRRFYARRTLRIFPAFYAMVIIAVAATALFSANLVHLDRGSLLSVATYTSDLGFPITSLGNSWSLAVEEQFYLLWPAALLLLMPRRRAWLVPVAVIFLAPAVRLFEYHLIAGHGHDPSWVFRFETEADALAIGCLLAMTRPWLQVQSWYRRILGSPLMVAVPLAVVGLDSLLDLPVPRPMLLWSLAFPIMNLGVVLCIDWGLTYPARRAARVLNTRLLVAVGVLSYSLYLWNCVFLNPVSGPPVSKLPALLDLAIVFVAAACSYFLIERPFLALRRRLRRGSMRRMEEPLLDAQPEPALIG